MNVRLTANKLTWSVKSLHPRRLKSRVHGPTVFVNSIPKAGTNLLTHCLSLFPMLRPSFTHVEMNQNRHPGHEEFEQAISSTSQGQYLSGHVFWSAENQRLLEDHDLDQLLMVRDPRDIVTSHYHYVTEINTDHRLNRYYTSRESDDERLMASIKGVDGEHTRDGDPLYGIGTWLDSFLEWMDHPRTTVVRFEDLIGPQGGGEKEAQRQTIREIADHLDVGLSDGEISTVAANTFSSNSSTYRKGLIGDWKNHFTPEHVDAFKEETEGWLIELGYERTRDWGART